MKVLIVGAGPVGQVFGACLQRGGSQVGLLVKPEHLERTKAGLQLHDLDRREIADWTPDWVLATGQPWPTKWDLVLLAVSSPALDGEWLEKLLEEDVPVIVLQGGLDDRAKVEGACPRSRITEGMIGFVAFDSGEGIHLWQPPLARSRLAGPDAEELAAALCRGGLAVEVADVRGAPVGSAFLLSFLELFFEHGGSLAEVRNRSGELAAAARERMGAVASHQGLTVPVGLVRGPLVWMLLTIAPRLAPFDLEQFLRLHFTKHSEQTRRGLLRIGTIRGTQPTERRGSPSPS